MAEYTVSGTGVDTGRKRSKKYLAASEAEARMLAERDGTSIETIEKTAIIPPSEYWLAEAREYGVSIPTEPDHHELAHQVQVARAQKDPPSIGNIRTAEQLNIQLPELITRKEFYDHVFATLCSSGRDVDLAAWFVYRITRSHSDRGVDLPGAEGPTAPKVREIAQELARDPKVIKSIKNYGGRSLRWFGIWIAPDGSEIPGGSKQSIAYKAAISLIRPAFGLPTYERKDGRSKSNIPATKGGGCMIAAGVVILASMLVIVL